MKPYSFILMSILSLTTLASAQTAQLLKDVNTIPLATPSYPSPMFTQPWTGIQTFSAVGNVILLSATSPATGYEIHASDGTKAGTRLLKDIRSGSLSPYAAYPVPMGANKMVFTAQEGSTGSELWVSDGTSARTQLIVDLIEGPASGASTYFATALGARGRLSWIRLEDRLGAIRHRWYRPRHSDAHRHLRGTTLGLSQLSSRRSYWQAALLEQLHRRRRLSHLRHRAT